MNTYVINNRLVNEFHENMSRHERIVDLFQMCGLGTPTQSVLKEADAVMRELRKNRGQEIRIARPGFVNYAKATDRGTWYIRYMDNMGSEHIRRVPSLAVQFDIARTLATKAGVVGPEEREYRRDIEDNDA